MRAPPLDTPEDPKLVLVSQRSAYGRKMWVPRNDLARLFCEFAKQQNLTLDQLKIIKKLGFKVALDQTKIDGLDDD